MPSLRLCKNCATSFPATAEHFSRNSRRADGLVVICKSCAFEKFRAYYADNRERLIARATASTRGRRLRPEVREKERVASREAKRRELADPERRAVLKARSKAWLAAHPEYKERENALRRERRAASRPKLPEGTCSRCGNVKLPLAQHYYLRSNGKPFGRQCKACLSELARERDAKAPGVKAARERERINADPNYRERKHASDAASYQKHKEKRLAAQKSYRQKPGVAERRSEHWRDRLKDPERREKVRLYLQGYHAKRMEDPEQREALRENSRLYARTRPEVMKAHTRNRRARLRAAEGAHTAADVVLILEAQNYRCFWCEDDISGGKHTVDHYHPIAKGGSNWPDNLRGACASCNYSKGDMLPDDFLAYRAKVAALRPHSAAEP